MYRHSDIKGNLYITFEIEFPENGKITEQSIVVSYCGTMLWYSVETTIVEPLDRSFYTQEKFFLKNGLLQELQLYHHYHATQEWVLDVRPKPVV